MTVKELMDILKEFPSEDEVILSKDSEGNGFSPLADYNAGYYVAYAAWGGDVYSDVDEVGHEGLYQRVLVLWPTN